MLNNLVLVGRTVEDLTVVTLDSGLKTCRMVIAVQRGFKNQDGEYDVDFVPVVLWDGIAEAVASNCKKGSVVGVKGRVQVRLIEVKDIKLNILEVVGERVSFINVKRPEIEESV